MKFNVKVIETLSRIVEVEAQSQEEAVELVTRQYRKSEIVLDSDDFDGYDIYGCGEV